MFDTSGSTLGTVSAMAGAGIGASARACATSMRWWKGLLGLDCYVNPILPFRVNPVVDVLDDDGRVLSDPRTCDVEGVMLPRLLVGHPLVLHEMPQNVIFFVDDHGVLRVLAAPSDDR